MSLHSKQAISSTKKLSLLIYNIIARLLPRSTMPYSLGSKYIRACLVRNFIRSCGENITVETGALLLSYISIGNNCDVKSNGFLGDDISSAKLGGS